MKWASPRNQGHFLNTYALCLWNSSFQIPQTHHKREKHYKDKVCGEIERNWTRTFCVDTWVKWSLTASPGTAASLGPTRTHRCGSIRRSVHARPLATQLVFEKGTVCLWTRVSPEEMKQVITKAYSHPKKEEQGICDLLNTGWEGRENDFCHQNAVHVS